MCHSNLKLYYPMVLLLKKIYLSAYVYKTFRKIGGKVIMYNSPNRCVNYHNHDENRVITR